MLQVDLRALSRGPVDTVGRLQPNDPVFEGLVLGLAGPVAVSVVGLVLLGFAGWLGGELVFVHSMGVKPPRAATRESSPRSRVA